MNELTHVSLFSGIGGIDLAAEWAGFTTVAFCERDPYCQKVLHKHWPDVPICDDIYEMGAEWLSERGIGTVTIASGGPPCQPVSQAGKRKGKADDRYLWPEMFRIISEVRPAWVLGENPLGFLNLGFDETVSELEGFSYEVQTFDIPACAVGANHERRRLFIVAHLNGERKLQQEKIKQESGRRFVYSPWQDPDFGKSRGVHGIPSRVDRLKCLGNAVVPQQVYPILKAIAMIEKREAG